MHNEIKEKYNEMFKELGYEWVDGTSYPVFQNEKNICIELAVPANSIAKFNRHPDLFNGCRSFTVKEILLCAKVISEMGEEADWLVEEEKDEA